MADLVEDKTIYTDRVHFPAVESWDDEVANEAIELLKLEKLPAEDRTKITERLFKYLNLRQAKADAIEEKKKNETGYDKAFRFIYPSTQNRMDEQEAAGKKPTFGARNVAKDILSFGPGVALHLAGKGLEAVGKKAYEVAPNAVTEYFAEPWPSLDRNNPHSMANDPLNALSLIPSFRAGRAAGEGVKDVGKFRTFLKNLKNLGAVRKVESGAKAVQEGALALEAMGRNAGAKVGGAVAGELGSTLGSKAGQFGVSFLTEGVPVAVGELALNPDMTAEEAWDVGKTVPVFKAGAGIIGSGAKAFAKKKMRDKYHFKPNEIKKGDLTDREFNVDGKPTSVEDYTNVIFEGGMGWPVYKDGRLQNGVKVGLSKEGKWAGRINEVYRKVGKEMEARLRNSMQADAWFAGKTGKHLYDIEHPTIEMSRQMNILQGRIDFYDNQIAGLKKQADGIWKSKKLSSVEKDKALAELDKTIDALNKKKAPLEVEIDNLISVIKDEGLGIADIRSTGSRAKARTQKDQSKGKIEDEDVKADNPKIDKLADQVEASVRTREWNLVDGQPNGSGRFMPLWEQNQRVSHNTLNLRDGSSNDPKFTQKSTRRSAESLNDEKNIDYRDQSLGSAGEAPKASSYQHRLDEARRSKAATTENDVGPSSPKLPGLGTMYRLFRSSSFYDPMLQIIYNGGKLLSDPSYAERAARKALLLPDPSAASEAARKAVRFGTANAMARNVSGANDSDERRRNIMLLTLSRSLDAERNAQTGQWMPKKQKEN